MASIINAFPSVLEAAHTNSPELIVGISSQLCVKWHHVDSLKSAMVVNTINQGFSFPRYLVIQHLPAYRCVYIHPRPTSWTSNLNNFMFEIVFCQWSLMGRWNITWREEIHTRSVSTISYCPVSLGVHDAPWAQNSGEPTRHGSSVRLKANAKWVCDVYSWVSGGADSPKRPCFPFETVFAPDAERKYWRLKKHKRPRSPIIFLLALLPC